MAKIEFEYTVCRPNPEGATLSHRKQGKVTAIVKGGDGPQVGTLAYGIGPGESVLTITRAEVDENVRRNGCARGLVRALREAYPGWRVLDSDTENDPDGVKLIAALREEGLVE